MTELDPHDEFFLKGRVSVRLVTPGLDVIRAAVALVSEWKCSQAWEEPGDEAKSALCDAVAVLCGEEPVDREKLEAYLASSAVGTAVPDATTTSDDSR